MSEANLLQTPVSEQDSCWADKLYTAGLFLFAFSCNFSISAAQISLGLALIGFIGLYRAGKTAIRATPLDKPLAFFVFAGILSVFRAEDLSLALFDTKKLLLVFCFYLTYWIKLPEKTVKHLFSVFIFSAGLAGIINSLQMPYITLVGNRPKGFFSSIMTFGECQAIGLMTALALFGLTKGNFSRLSLLLLAAVATAYSVMFSMVRSAWVGLLAGLPVLLIYFPRRTAFALLIITCAASPFILINQDIQDRLMGLNPVHTVEIAKVQMTDKFSSSSLQGNYHRLTAWWRGFQMLADNFSFGVGLDNVKPWFERLASEFEIKNNMIWGHQHNNFMQFLVTTGIFGLTAFFYIIIAAIKFFLEPYANKGSGWRDSLRLCPLAIFICFIAFGIGEFSWADEEVAMMTFFITGLMMNGHQKDYASPASPLATS